MAQKKRKETHTIERNRKDKQRVSRKHEGRKRERDRYKNRKWCPKKCSKWNIQQRRRKVCFCSKRETNKRTECKREKSFVGGKRKMMNEKEDQKKKR